MDYDKFCTDIMGLSPQIRYTAVLDRIGEKISGGYRPELVPLLSDEEQKMELYHAGQRWESRKHIDHKIGKAKYSVTEYEKLKRITFPIDEKHLLLISLELNAEHHQVIDKILDLISKDGQA